VALIDLPPHHYWTRWWLRRFGDYADTYPPKWVSLHDRLLLTDVGEPMRYPKQAQEAIQQLRMMRQKFNEPNDNIIFCDSYGAA
jgi:hypothetical protein